MWELAGGGVRLVDFVLLVMLAEGVWLVAGRRRPIGPVLLALLPGALLMLALRAALAGAGWPWIVAPLTLSLPAHLADLAARGWLARRRGR